MKKIIYLFIALTLSGCATSTRVLMPEYKSKRNPGKSMGIIADNIIVNNPKDVNDDLGEGNPEEVFNDYFQYTFSRYTIENSNLSVANFPSEVDTTNLVRTVLIISEKDSIEVALPLESSIYQTKPVYFDYVLVIDSLEVSKLIEVGVGMDITSGLSNGLSMSSKGFFDFKYSYAIWDNEQNQVVAYGKNEIKREYLFALTKQHWDDTVIAMIKNIIKETPFDTFTGKFSNFKNKKK